MTPENDSSGDDDSDDSTRSSPETSGSRFDDLFDRVDHRAAKPDRSEGDRDRSTTGDGSDSTESDADAETADVETDATGWTWGEPARARAPDHAFDPADAEPEDAEVQSLDVPESGGDRIWNAKLGDTFGGNDADATSLDGQMSDPGDGATSESAVPTGPSNRPASVDERSEPSDPPKQTTPAEPTARDRWAELGANLDAGTRDESPIDRSSVPDESRDHSGTEKQELDHERDESSWDPMDATATASDEHPSEPLSILNGSRSADLGRVTDAASVLVLGPAGHSISDAICSRFLMSEADSRDVLFVTFDESPGDRIEICHRADGWSGGKIGIVEVGRGSRNATNSAITSGSEGGSITIRQVSKPGDLSKLGILISQLVTEFDKTSRETVLCFHTLSALHNRVGTKTLFRFLNTLQGRLQSADVIGHYHMDPELHDELVVETLRPIFDSIIRYSTDGDLDIE